MATPPATAPAPIVVSKPRLEKVVFAGIPSLPSELFAHRQQALKKG
jgi:hypothetical protein